MVWWGVSTFLLGPIVAVVGYIVIRVGYGTSPGTALLFIGVLAPVVLALGLGWQIGAAVNRYDDSELEGQKQTTAGLLSTKAGATSSDDCTGRCTASSRTSWLSWIPERLDNFFILFWAGSIGSGGFITLIWMFFVQVTPAYPMPNLGVVVAGLFPMLILVSYFGCLAVTGAPFVSAFWQETTGSLGSTEARRDHILRVGLVVGGFFILTLLPWGILPIPLNFRMPVTWALAFTYLFFVLTLLPFLNMARPLTPEENETIVPEEIHADPHTTVWVATVGIRSTAMATGVWPFRRIFIGEDLLEDDSLSAESLQAILYHERGHHVLGHLRLTAGGGVLFFCGVGGILAVVSSSMQTLGVAMGILAFAFRFGLVRWVRRAELAADEFVGQQVGSEAAIAALKSVASHRAMRSEERAESTSLPWGAPFVIEWFLRVHPSVEDRIAVFNEQPVREKVR